MSKLLRSELKSIVKECLVEILSEGLQETNKSLKENYKKKKSNVLAGNTTRRSGLDNISYNKSPRKKPSIKSKITNDPILNEMLADTALSTLQEQHAAERKGGTTGYVSQGDAASKIVAENNVEDLFGESSTKWAALAFSD